MEQQFTREQLETALRTALAVSNTLRQMGRMSAAQLFQQLQGHMTMEAYQALIASLEDHGLIQYDDSLHVITWIGPRNPLEKAARPNVNDLKTSKK